MNQEKIFLALQKLINFSDMQSLDAYLRKKERLKVKNLGFQCKVRKSITALIFKKEEIIKTN